MLQDTKTSKLVAAFLKRIVLYLVFMYDRNGRWSALYNTKINVKWMNAKGQSDLTAPADKV